MVDVHVNVTTNKTSGKVRRPRMSLAVCTGSVRMFEAMKGIQSGSKLITGTGR